jgi:hypothetical protein
VINTLVGGVTDTALPPDGNPITRANYNKPEDQTIAFVLSPFRDANTDDPKGWQPSNSNNADFKYPQKIAEIETALQNAIPGIAFIRQGYTRLNYNLRDDVSQINKNERGMALFQSVFRPASNRTPF